MSQPTHETLLSGDLYAGGYGPTIILILEPERGLHWFHGLLARLGRGEGSPIDLVTAPEAKIDRIESFNLRLVVEQPKVALQRVDVDRGRVDFQWTQSASGWSLAAELVEPFFEGGSGHQYLSLEGHDAALVEVSCREDLPTRRSLGGSSASAAEAPEAERRQEEQ